jgi:hypothetical protein
MARAGEPGAVRRPITFAVLFLVDSKTNVRSLAEGDQISCLNKPFNALRAAGKSRALAGVARRGPGRPIAKGTDDQISSRHWSIHL